MILSWNVTDVHAKDSTGDGVKVLKYEPPMQQKKTTNGPESGRNQTANETLIEVTKIRLQLNFS